MPPSAMPPSDNRPYTAPSEGRKAHIRPIEVADAASFLAHRERTYAQTPFMAFLPGESTTTVEQEEAIIRNLAASDRHALLVAVANEQVVGFVGMAPAFMGAKARHRANLAISVERACWGQGIGTALMQAALAAAAARGFEQIELSVYAENDRARRLYRKMGFEEWGTLPHAAKHPDGSYHDEVYMVLRLPGEQPTAGEAEKDNL